MSLWPGGHADMTLRVLDAAFQSDPLFIADDDDLLDLYLELTVRKKLLRMPAVIPRGHFDLDLYPQSEARFAFRFEPFNIHMLADFFFPNREPIQTSAGDKCAPVDALCMFLRQMAHTFVQRDLVSEFFCSIARISRITNHVARIVAAKARAVLSGLDEDYIKENIEDWCDAVQDVAGVETGVFGFIDSKLFFTTRLLWCKKAVYSGHKHRSGTKYQTVLAPSGIVIGVYGPAAGRQGDGLVLANSGILQTLSRLYDWGVVNQPANYDPAIPTRGIAIYGDSAYPRRKGMMSAYKCFELAAVPNRAVVQDGLNEARAEQEHWYGNLVMNWRGIANPLEMKLGKRPVTAYIWSVLLFENCRVCSEGTNQIGRKFKLQPPTLSQFLGYCNDRESRLVGGVP